MLLKCIAYFFLTKMKFCLFQRYYYNNSFVLFFHHIIDGIQIMCTINALLNNIIKYTALLYILLQSTEDGS